MYRPTEYRPKFLRDVSRVVTSHPWHVGHSVMSDIEHLGLPPTVRKVFFLALASRGDGDVTLITSAHVTLILPLYHVT